jgi:hypothetical protein
MTVVGWTVPDVSFTPTQVGAARGVLEQLGGASRVELAFLGGSLAVGLGHATSDIDLYVVGAGLPEGELTYQHDGLWVHVNPLRAGMARELVELGTRYRATGMDRSQLAADPKTLNALVRLATGWRLLASDDWARALESFSQDTVRRILIARNANVFAAYAEDADGALRVGDLLTAATASRLALEAGCEAALASAGDLYVGPKFLFRRLARTPVTAPWCDHVWRLCHRDPGPHQGFPDSIRAAVEERLSVGSLLLAWCAVDGWDAPLDRLPPLDLCRVSRPGAGPRRSGFFAPVRFADGWALIGPDDGYEVGEDTVRLWRRLTGRPLSDLIASIPVSEPRLAGRDATEIESAVAVLAAIGAVVGHRVETALTAGGDLLARPSPRFSCHPKVAPPASTAGPGGESPC